MAASKPTLADVARAAGVSVPTVSKAISGRSDVAEATRERVLGAMHELGYLARGSAGSGERHGLIELVIGGIGTLWSIEIVRGAEEAAHRNNRSLVVTNSNHSTFTTDTWIDAVLAHKAVGVVVATSTVDADLSRLTTAGVPVVHLDVGRTDDTEEAQVGATNWAGMRDATRHMVKLGHTRIGFIGGDPEVQVAQDRREGYTAALRQAKLPVDPDLMVDGDFIVAGGVEGARTLLDRDDPPTAIVAASDLEAMGVYQVAQERGLRIPEDLSVTGFDDTVICEYLSPPLTTVRQPLTQMADQAVRLLTEMSRSGEDPHPRIELATTLVVRGSTAQR